MRKLSILLLLIIAVFSNVERLGAQNASALLLVKQARQLANKAKYNQAIIYLKKAGVNFNKTKHWKLYIDCQNKIGEYLVRQGQLDEALKVCSSTQIYLKNQSAQALTQQGGVLNVIGEIYLNKGQNDQALESFQKALNIYTRQQFDAGKAHCYNNLGLVYWNTGNRALALEYHQKALTLRKSLYSAQHSEVAASYNNIGLIYSQNKPKEAYQYYEKALDIYKKEKQPIKVANTYNNMAIIKQRERNFLEALDFFDEVLAIRKKVYNDQHPNVAFVYTNIGQVYADQENLPKALEYQQKALDIYKKNFGEKHPELASVYNLMGAIHTKQSNYRTALNTYQKALRANVPDFNSADVLTNPEINQYYNADILINSLLLKAQTFEALHFGKSLRFRDLKMALQTLELCDDLLEKVRRLRTNQSDKIALGKIGSEIYEDGIRISMAMSEVSLRKKHYFQKAFYFAEKSKSAVLLDAITDTDAKQFAGIPPKLLAQEKQLKADISYYEQQLAAGLETAKEKVFREKLFAFNRQYDVFTKQLETNYPDYYNLKFNTLTVSVPQIQLTLDNESAMILYFIGQKTQRLYYFYISKRKFKALDLPLMERFDKHIISMRNRLYFKRRIDKTGLKLYKQLFPQKISRKIKKLILIPDGFMSTLPFEALITSKVTPETSLRNYPYLIKKVGVSYSYSATLFLQSKDPISASATSKDILLMAPVSFKKQSNLPATEREVNQIQALFAKKNGKTRLYLKTEAREEQIKSSELKNYRYVHLATHGVVNEQYPELSRVLLSKGNKDDGALYFGEIFNLELSANLVTLSACETGLGKLSKGEGIIGLSRALLYAGAKSVLVSLWSVADESTSQLMINFYDYLLAGKTKHEALRQAKLRLISEGKDYQGNPIPPFYWAPFVLIGK
ncbi:CHAT domain-containing tetratricopeptide repeat protein [Microscilla marina]|uniref:Tetratricopeptide TPR_3 n=1 Tax=Microscilla marina ATCC 23134 TaxID=313606 RepID=A1ZJG8_MICM2|nr:CHAT domain-containing tetratricopeptide repeat protein [Microscilla marina]EAY29271.1 tetratricopeptide TPR_3 [Microscilla marina ATCC 23134]